MSSTPVKIFPRDKIRGACECVTAMQKGIVV
jgi:hypothetical protein